MLGVSFSEILIILIVAALLLDIRDTAKATKFVKSFLRKAMHIRNEVQQIVSGIRKDLEAVADGAQSAGQPDGYVIDSDNKLLKVGTDKARLDEAATHKPRRRQRRIG